ncbi:hypothetical protein HSBAA_56070 [Vreelandella sulfidaeris]|uniref:Uncharacterized protein n=1 Tax=Vreelandella sulfidaeris TaxID=115553 RepID=A0A455UI06_9GAMM|nr:hypothetical protein HSBAA_56070 [Halomonas sulfidaeris]
MQEDGRNADLVIGQVRDMPSGNIDDYIAIAFLAIVEKKAPLSHQKTMVLLMSVKALLPLEMVGSL